MKSLINGAARVVPRSDASRSLRRVSHLHTVAPPRSLQSTSLRPVTGHSCLRSYSSAPAKLYSHQVASPRSSPRNHILRSSNKLSRNQTRSCSYQRHSMCRHSLGADVVESGVDVTKGRVVLPTNVKPLHYRLTLEPNLESFEYYGTVEIE